MNSCLRRVQSTRKYLQVYYAQRICKSTENSTSSSDSSSSGSSSSSDSDDPKLNEATNVDDKLNKLNKLLIQLVQQDTVQESKIKLAQPIRKEDKVQYKKDVKESDEMKIQRTVREVAKDISVDDQKPIESELLMKLLSTQETPKGLMDVIKDMKIEREKTFTERNRATQVRSILQQVSHQRDSKAVDKIKRTRPPTQQRQPEEVTEAIDLFGAEALGIFTNVDQLKLNILTETWADLQNRDLRLAFTQPPANYFQQMILWTEQGKLWKFPIDNEQDLDEEKKVHFSQHVFLEDHLEPWCPQKGPIRHFMELVCVGLSKNHYLTAQAKKEHIDWFKDYFESKKPLLKEVGAIQG